MRRRKMWRSTIDRGMTQNGDSFFSCANQKWFLPIHHYDFFSAPFVCVFIPYVTRFKTFYTSLSEMLSPPPPPQHLYSTNCLSPADERAHTVAVAFGTTNWTSMMQHFSSLYSSLPFSFFLVPLCRWSSCTILFIAFPPFFTYNFYSLYFHIFLLVPSPIHPSQPFTWTHARQTHIHNRLHWIPSEALRGINDTWMPCL